MATEGAPPTEAPAPTETETASKAEAPALPGFYTDPNFVLGDVSATWRYGKPPDYSKTRRLFAETKSQNHPPTSLPHLVENLVKNWEIEASFKTKLDDWKTVNASRYTFSMNGGTPQRGQHMLEVGSYNSIISPNEYYSPEYSDFASTHKTFKRMMPFFAWEVLEVYSGPPKVAFRWRHWGQMKNDYVGFNNRAEKVTARAHGGWIDIQGITVADLDGEMKILHLETWFDPMDMFRQIAPKGIVNKQPMNIKTPGASSEDTKDVIIPEVAVSPALPREAHQDNQIPASHEPAGPLLPHEASQEHHAENGIHKDKPEPVKGVIETNEESHAVTDDAIPLALHEPSNPLRPQESSQEHIPENETPDDDAEFMDAHEHQIDNQEIVEQNPESESTSTSTETVAVPVSTASDIAPEQSKDDTDINLPQINNLKLSGPNTKSAGTETANAVTGENGAETQMQPGKGEAVAVSKENVETIMTHEEMSRIMPAECPFFNRE